MSERSEAEDLARWASQAEVNRLKAMIQELCERAERAEAERDALRALLRESRERSPHPADLRDRIDAWLAWEKRPSTEIRGSNA